jgi:hypothetical protein
MNGRIGDFEKIGMFLVWEIGADGLKRPHRRGQKRPSGRAKSFQGFHWNLL